MSNYTKATNFATKDTLPTGDSGKIVKGTEIDNEFNAIASAISSKADTASPTFSGTPAAPTAASGTNTTQVATTAFVAGAVSDSLTATATLTNKTLTSPTINTPTINTPTISGGSITGITDLAVADGGTGVSTIAANAVVLGNGTSAVQTVAPGASGNVLTSNGTTWASASLQVIGVNQTWQSVTRVIGTTYTNSTGKAILLLARANRSTFSSSGLNITIDSLELPLCVNTNSGGGNTAVGSIIIPNGSSYVLSVNSDPLTSYEVWELR
jgi:hypothetical protein